jgi:hypothetical protein
MFWPWNVLTIWLKAMMYPMYFLDINIIYIHTQHTHTQTCTHFMCLLFAYEWITLSSLSPINKVLWNFYKIYIKLKQNK